MNRVLPTRTRARRLLRRLSLEPDVARRNWQGEPCRKARRGGHTFGGVAHYKFTPERAARIVAAVRAGNRLQVAYRVGGVAVSTALEWRRLGRRASELAAAGKDLSAEDTAFAAFEDDLTLAESEAEARLVTMWAAAAKDDWRAARDLLARRFPERWAPLERREVAGAEGGPVTVAAEVRGDVCVTPILSDEQRTAEVLAVLVKAGVLPQVVGAAICDRD